MLLKKWCRHQDLNSGPTDNKSVPYQLSYNSIVMVSVSFHVRLPLYRKSLLHEFPIIKAGYCNRCKFSLESLR